jgi:hypothetical protein
MNSIERIKCGNGNVYIVSDNENGSLTGGIFYRVRNNRTKDNTK